MERKRRARWVLRYTRAIFEILYRRLLGMLHVVGWVSFGNVDGVWMRIEHDGVPLEHL